MTIPSAVLIFILIVIAAGAIALSAFIWAIRTKQFSYQHVQNSARILFDENEPEGFPQDMIFKPNHE